MRSFFPMKMLRHVLLSGLAGSVLMLSPLAIAEEKSELPEDIPGLLADISTTLTGTYLSARLAQEEDDLELAAHFFEQALVKDPDSPVLLERNFTLTLATGNHETAFALADRMAEMHNASLSKQRKPDENAKAATEAEAETEPTPLFDNRVTPMVQMALGIKALKGKNYSAAIAHFDAGLDILQHDPVSIQGTQPFRRPNEARLLSASALFGPFAMISQTVLRAWSIIGQDRGALDNALEPLISDDENEVNQFFFSLHAGLIAAYAKKYDRAEELLQESLDADPNAVPTVTALLNVLIKADKKQKAQEVLNSFMSSNADLEEKAWVKATFEPLNPVATSIRTPQDGAAEYFATLGDALSQERAAEGGALYLQYADFLRPKHDRTGFALARLFERMGKNNKSLGYYNRIQPQSAVYRKAQRQSSFVLARLERTDEAIERLKTLLNGDASDLDSVTVLSRIYQSEKRFREAIDILTRGLDTVAQKRDIHWSLYFLRGSAYDQVKDWSNTESDMETALKLFPNQPTVLNYLGYSWVDRGLNLDRAIEMIRQAVALRPFDGFFVDSLGWAHFQLNEFEEAVNFLERAVELRPLDPTITDHLGDAYWKAGREDEARFQWLRVKTMDPTQELLDNVDEKIANGLVDKPNDE